jgi:hypothetical protein
MTSLGFENYAEALKIYLARYREVSMRPPSRRTKAVPLLSKPRITPPYRIVNQDEN